MTQETLVRSIMQKGIIGRGRRSLKQGEKLIVSLLSQKPSAATAFFPEYRPPHCLGITAITHPAINQIAQQWTADVQLMQTYL